MSDDMLNNLDKLTRAVEKLTSKVDILDGKVLKTTADVQGLGNAAGNIPTQMGQVSTQTGMSNLTVGASSMQLGTDNARFNTQPMQTSTQMSTALGKFTYKWDSSNMDKAMAATSEIGNSGDGGGGGGFMGMNFSGAGRNAAAAVANLGMAAVAGTYAAMPDLGATMQRNIGYYQAALKNPGTNQSSLARNSLNAMGGGLSSVGGDQLAASALTNAGFTAGSSNYMKYMGEAGSAFKYLGMDNATAAQSLAQLQSGPSAANLFQYGIATTDEKGNMKSVGDISKQVMNLVNPGGIKVSNEQMNTEFLKGYGNSVLQALFPDNPGMQEAVKQGMIDINAGKNPDLTTRANAQGGTNNPNSALDITGRMNYSQTDLMDAATKAMIKGFENAADTVEAFNRGLKDVVDVAGYAKGFMAGVGGTNIGAGLAAALPHLVAAINNAADAIDAAVPFGGNPGYGGRGIGGPSVGYGAGFGAGTTGGSGGKGGEGLVAGAQMTAGYGAEGSVWSGTNNQHTGQDFAAEYGAPVKVRASGTVIETDLGSTYGKSILVDHGDYQTLYAHLSEESVAVGDQVKSGQVIGKVGDSGGAKGPHLHYEVRQGKNNPVNPSSIVSITTPNSNATTTTSNLGIGSSTSDLMSMGYATPGTQSYDVLGNGPTTTGDGIDGSPEVKLPAMADKELVGILTQAGFTGKHLAEAYGIAKAESGGRPTAYNPRGKDNSYGLFQINLYGGLRQERLNKTWHTSTGDKFKLGSDQDLYDPLKNAQVAYHMSNGGTNWSAWTTYTSGKYLDNVDKVPTSVGGPTVAYGASIPAAAGSPTHSGNKNVYVTLKIEKASEEEATRFALKVKKMLQDENDHALHGGS